MTEVRRDGVVRAALFLISLAAYVLTAAPGAFWLDSSELAAAGASLGVPHAPGHPLDVILGYAASLLPFGPLGFRVTLVSAVCAAWAVVWVCDLAVLADAPAQRTAGVRRLAAATVALTFGASSAVWLQSVRAEVYTLQLALALWLTRTGVTWLQAKAPRPARFALAASFVLGLGAGNHHYLLLFHVPCLLVLLGATADARRRALRLLPAMTAVALVGLAVYALLPCWFIRGSTGEAVSKTGVRSPTCIRGEMRAWGRCWKRTSRVRSSRRASWSPWPNSDRCSSRARLSRRSPLRSSTTPGATFRWPPPARVPAPTPARGLRPTSSAC